MRTRTPRDVGEKDGMRMKFLGRTFVLAATVAVVATVASLSAQAGDAWAGTWKLNLAKSTYELGPAPRSAVSRLEPSQDGWKVSQDGVDTQGTPAHVEMTLKFDGKDYPVNGIANTTWALTRIDDHTYDLVAKRDGRVTTTTRTVVSADGKTRRSTTTGKNAQGHTVSNVAVYERQ